MRERRAYARLPAQKRVERQAKDQVARSRQQEGWKRFNAYSNRKIGRAPDKIHGAEGDQDQGRAARLVKRRLGARISAGFRWGFRDSRHDLSCGGTTTPAA